MQLEANRAWRNSITPQPEESIASIVVRLAPRGLVTVEQLLSVGLKTQAKSVAGLPSNRDALELLAAIGSFSLQDLLSRAWSSTENGFIIYGREMPDQWLTPIKRRLAPGRLAADGDTPFARVHWQLNVFSCDVETGECLIDRCPNCAAYLQWNNVISIANCVSCNFDLRQAEVIKVPDDTWQAARQFYKYLLNNQPKLAEPFSHLDDLSIFNAMEWFGYFMDLRVGKFLCPSVYNALNGFVALQDWPAPFDQTIEAFLGDLAEPTSAVSFTAKQSLFSDLLKAIERAGTNKLHTILSQRAVELLGESTAAELKMKDVIFSKKLNIFSKRKDQSTARGLRSEFRTELMRSNHF